MKQKNSAILTTPPTKNNYNKLLPTIYLAYRLDTIKGKQINFSLNETVNRPAYSALNPSTFFFDHYTITQGNPALQSERNLNADLSFDFNSNYSVGASFNNSSNIIIQYYAIKDLDLINSMTNIKRYSSYAINSNASFHILSFWTCNLWTQLSRMSFNGILNDQILVNNLTSFRTTASTQLKIKKSWSLELNGSYRTQVTFGQGIYLPIWRVNSAIQKKIFKNKGTITLTAKDIFHTWIIKRDIPLNNGLVTVNHSSDTQQIGLAFSYRFGTSKQSPNQKSGLESERKRVN